MWKIIIKDLKLFLVDKKALVLSLILPVALISLFVVANGALESNDKQSAPKRILLSDEDSTATSRNIVKDLDSIPGIIWEEVPLEKARDHVLKGDRIAVLVFYEGFEDSVSQGGAYPMELLYDKSRESEVGLLQQALIGNLMGTVGKQGMEQKVKSQVMEKYQHLNPEILTGIEKDISSGFSDSEDIGGGELKVTGIKVEEQINWRLIHSVAGTIIMMLLFTMMGTGGSILEELEEGTLKRLFLAPVHPSAIFFAKFIMVFIVGFIQLIILLLFSWLAFGLDLFVNVIPLIFAMFVSAFACSSFGVFLASVSRSRKQLESFGMVIILVMSAIGGSMIPTFVMPEIMQKMAVVSINYWSIQSFYDVFGRLLPLKELLPEIAVLMGIGAGMLVISYQIFRKNIVGIFS